MACARSVPKVKSSKAASTRELNMRLLICAALALSFGVENAVLARIKCTARKAGIERAGWQTRDPPVGRRGG